MMPLQAARRRRHVPDGTLPLVNIVLLLVLAFMIAGTVTDPLPAGFSPIAAAGRDAGSAAPAPLRLVMDTDGQVSEAGRVLDTDQTGTALADAGRSGVPVSLTADARAPAVRVLALLGTAESAGVDDVVLVTVAARQ